MTDRIQAFTVVLEKDYRDDDVEGIRNALLRIKGVLSVEPHVTQVGDYVARLRAHEELAEKLRDVLKPTWLRESPFK